MEESAPIRVLLADDDELYLHSLRELVQRQPELRVVGEAPDGLRAIELADELAPDAAVIDIHMPIVDGVTAVARRPARRCPALELTRLHCASGRGSSVGRAHG
jgi:two-component system, chemotaxis family, protein-glutamate methylesterase/glutaminase